MIAQLGNVQDIGLALESPRALAYALDQVKQMVVFNPKAGASFRDVRLLAELSRDVVGRARCKLSLQEGPALGRNGLADEVVRALAPKSGRLAVVEWMDAGEWRARFVTIINADGAVASHWLQLPDVDEKKLLRWLRSRLMGWRLDKEGDPFDVPDWRRLKWLHTQLDPHLKDSDHLVFIEDEETAGLPWHVAAPPRWTASYVASWSTLLTLRQRELLRPRTLGAFAVPLFNDGKSVTDAFVRSVQRTRDLAQVLHCRLIVAEGPAADREAFAKIMNQSDMVQVMCHGFAQEGEISLVVAHDGVVPPGNRVALAGVHGRPYRLTWRQIQGLGAAPALVFSAACSSGLATVAGFGERLGLFNALFPSGRRALVAPWWDVVADAVLPIADEVFARYARGEESLAAVLSAACSDAANKLPHWLAWALAIEGDWQ